MIFYDFEVFKYNWLIKALDMNTQSWITIWDDPQRLIELYEKTSNDIYVGFNNKHYDQYIYKGIMLGMNPKVINDKIIVDGLDGWQISKQFNRIPMINYDVMNTRSAGLKTLEGFMGSNIKESDVDFRIDRPLTDEEKAQTEMYCEHDVEETVKVFMQRIDTFNATHGIIKAFSDRVNINDIGETHARITAKVLDCRKIDTDDEFDFFFLPCIRLNKYKVAMDWFESLIGNPENMDPYWYYKQSFELDVAGVPHVFGFGGIHGAPVEPVHLTGALYHVDVSNYYPSMLIAWGLVTRAANNDNYPRMYKIRKELKYKQVHAKTQEEKKMYKKMQDPYKIMLNGLSGAMKDRKNAAYDPRNNNCMCINGQLMLLDLIEHLEIIPGFRLIQSNTDGLIIQLPDTREAFDMMDDICYEWEMRCSTNKCQILLETDQIKEIYQKDVNNYLWTGYDGDYERKGGYVKELNPLDYDLPIVNTALVEYMMNKVPVEKTITDCNDLIMFQKIVKLSSKYDYVEHEHCTPTVINAGKRVIRTEYQYDHTDRYDYKCYRVFASNDLSDGRLLKVKNGKNGEKFANTPDHCFINNDDIDGAVVSHNLDKQWYIDLAKKRLADFGIK